MHARHARRTQAATSARRPHHPPPKVRAAGPLHSELPRAVPRPGRGRHERPTPMHSPTRLAQRAAPTPIRLAHPPAAGRERICASLRLPP
jgi:hypothetical protein